MKIGLYSKYGRSDIIKIAKEINQSKIKSNVEDMISFRSFLINSVQQHHKRILKITDFYSLSDFRDMLFHEQEHRFTIPKIKDFINKNSLYFCGFESSTIVSNFKEKAISELAIYDLDKWKSYEDSHPTTFRGMYNFWCQKL